jgi:hypothetical protein
MLKDFGLGVGLAAEIVFAADPRTVGLINEDVVVASGADYAVDGFAELLMRGGGFMVGAGLFAADGHRDFILT